MSNPWTDEFTALIVRRYHAGEGPGALALQFGLTRNQVNAKLDRLNELRRRPNSPAVRRITPRAPKPVVAKVAEPPRPKAPPVARVVNPFGPNPRGVLAAIRSAPPVLVEPPPTLIAGSLARPWTERLSGQCTWPMGGAGPAMLSCCAPVFGRGWCREHFKAGLQPSAVTRRVDERVGKDVARAVR